MQVRRHSLKKVDPLSTFKSAPRVRYTAIMIASPDRRFRRRTTITKNTKTCPLSSTPLRRERDERQIHSIGASISIDIKMVMMFRLIRNPRWRRMEMLLRTRVIRKRYHQPSLLSVGPIPVAREPEWLSRILPHP